MGNIDRYNSWRNSRKEVFERGEDSMTRAVAKPGTEHQSNRATSHEGDWAYNEIDFPQTADAYRELFMAAPIGKWRSDDEKWLPPEGYGLLLLPDHTGCITSNDDGEVIRFDWREKGDLTIECRMEGGDWETVIYDFDTYRDEHEKEFVFLYDTAHNFTFWGIAHSRPLLLSRTISAEEN